MTLLRFLFHTCAHHNICCHPLQRCWQSLGWRQWRIQTFRRGGRGGGSSRPWNKGEAVSKKLFFRPQFGIKVRREEGGGIPGPSPGSTTGRSFSFSGRHVPDRLFLGFPFSNACKNSPLGQLQVKAHHYFVGGLADSSHCTYILGPLASFRRNHYQWLSPCHALSTYVTRP